MLNVQNADVVTDFNGLAKLKNDARNQDPEALKQVAKQFESLFLNMILKSMRQAKLGDGLMDNDQSKMYQDMYDQQLSTNLAGEGGLGLAEIMVKQLSPKQVQQSAETEAEVSEYIKHAAPLSTEQHNLTVYERTKMGMLRRDWPEPSRIEGIAPPEDNIIIVDDAPELDKNSTKQAFVDQLLPLAQKAAAELGVEPKVLIAQAALETGWGRSVIKNRDGSSSYNLFNIKAGSAWDGRQARVSTLEFEGGVPVKVMAGFRAYESYADSFNDYVKFIKDKPRYADAIKQVSNPERYMQELQQAGYATDPHYAGKVMSIYNSRAFTTSSPAETDTLAMQ